MSQKAIITNIVDFPHLSAGGSSAASANTRLLTLESETPIGFRGGMWLMANLGVLLPNGRTAKRAYSILSPDQNQKTFRLAVKHIATELTSAAIHKLQTGDLFRFSGPYGKNFYFPLAEEWAKLSEPLQSNNKMRNIWLIATDTGITAILGVLQSEALRLAKAKNPELSVHTLWLTDYAEAEEAGTVAFGAGSAAPATHAAPYFLPLEFVRNLCPQIRIHQIPPPYAPWTVQDTGQKTTTDAGELATRASRKKAARDVLQQERKQTGAEMTPDLLFLAGDGWLIEDILPEILNYANPRVYKDLFFNKAQKDTDKR